MSAKEAARLTAARVAQIPRWLTDPRPLPDPDSAPARWEDMLRIVAASDAWRTLTVEQLEALTGVSKVDGSWLPTLWSEHLLELSLIQTALAAGPRARLATLLRPARTSTHTHAFEDRLTWPEWVSVTGGMGLEHNRQYSRHNVLATEFGLRMAEFGNVAAVLGEKFAGLDALAYTGSGVAAPSTGANGGSDLVLVRPDGLRVAVEVTASKVGGWFTEKAERLAAALHRRPLAETGMVVLFVVAPHQDASAAETTQTLRMVKRGVQKAVRRYPGAYGSYTAERMAVASWADLFPARHCATRALSRLPVERPTGMLPGRHVDDEAVWERSELLAPASVRLDPVNPEWMTSILSAVKALRSSPHFLRGDGVSGIDLNAMSMSRAGVETVPQVEGTRPAVADHGPVRPAKTPSRLRF